MELNDFMAGLKDEDEQNRFIEELRKECICHTCPTYSNCARESKERLYCILGTSDCPVHKRKCMCPLDCPVYEKYEFKSSFYCSKDREIKKDKLVYSKKVIRV